MISVLRQRPGVNVGLAAVVPLAAADLLGTVRGQGAAATALLILVAVVVAIATTGVRIAGLVASLAAALGFDVFLTEPYGSLTITRAQDVETTILLLLIGGIVTEVSLWGQRQHAARARQAGYLDGVVLVAEGLASGQTSPEQAARLLETEIEHLLDLDVCRYAAGRFLDFSVPIVHHDGTITREGRPYSERDGLPVDQVTALPVQSGGILQGHFQLVSATHVSRPSREQLRIAALLADQLGRAVGDTSTTAAEAGPP